MTSDEGGGALTAEEVDEALRRGRLEDLMAVVQHDRSLRRELREARDYASRASLDRAALDRQLTEVQERAAVLTRHLRGLAIEARGVEAPPHLLERIEDAALLAGVVAPPPPGMGF